MQHAEDRSLAHPEAVRQLRDRQPLSTVEPGHRAVPLRPLLAQVPPRLVVLALRQGASKAGRRDLAAVVPVHVVLRERVHALRPRLAPGRIQSPVSGVLCCHRCDLHLSPLY